MQISPAWTPAPPRWDRRDLLALVLFTVLVGAFFRDVVLLRRALFYFDISEINFPYRDFFANELKAGRFSRWIPGLYCGHPLYSESQAGYLHPLKYLLYPWLPTWQAFGLDCVLSVWLIGLGAYGWLRRHVGRAGAWAGAVIMAFSGFTWAHFVHTSMLNALASVPFAFWGLEVAWDKRSVRAAVLGGVALACQVFAGHLQDVILTGSALAIYGAYRAATERTWRARSWAFGAVLLMGVVCVGVSAVQWIPSKELIDRSPRAGGLSWNELTYGSWSPELLPAFLLREAYGTRARDTDWLDGFYPHLEMNTYIGVVGFALALIGWSARRNRWVAFWPILASLSIILMLGRFTFVMDVFPYVPFVNRGRVPVRYHLWFVVAASALAAVGVDRLARVDCGRVRLRHVVHVIGGLALVSALILAVQYYPAITQRNRWPLKYHTDRYAWLATELVWSFARTAALALAAALVALWASGQIQPRRRQAAAVLLCAFAAADLLLAHTHDVPTIEPAYWTATPESARWLHDQPDTERIFGERPFASGEPGYASAPVDFFKVRELLAWSLPVVWGLNSTAGETPIIPTRRLLFSDHRDVIARFDVESLSHVIASSANAEQRLGPGIRVGGVTIHRNPDYLPRARLVGRPAYAANADEASRLIPRLGNQLRDRVIVEDPDRPLAVDAHVEGTARLVRDDPEHVVVEIDAKTPAYLVLADSFDPGWTAQLNDRIVPIRPAYAAFRAVYVPAGKHRLAFDYEPAGFRFGLMISIVGVVACATACAKQWPLPKLRDPHATLAPRAKVPIVVGIAVAILIVGSVVRIEPSGAVGFQQRWDRAFHRFTWGAGIEAMRPMVAR